MKIFVTGDTHIPADIGKISNAKWKIAKELTSDDMLIVLGDFGLIWTMVPTLEELHWTSVLTKKRYKVCFVDGNHENHPRLKELPQVEFFGGVAGYVTENIYHLIRGEVYNIGDKKFFTFGGANSIDKGYRQEGISWWREEVGSVAEMECGLNNLEKNGYCIDYILSHTVPVGVANNYLKSIKSDRLSDEHDPTEKYLEHVCSITKYDKLYAGHWHDNWNDGKHYILYSDIIQVV